MIDIDFAEKFKNGNDFALNSCDIETMSLRSIEEHRRARTKNCVDRIQFYRKKTLRMGKSVELNIFN